MNSKGALLALLAVCQSAAMALCFSATAEVPSLQAEFSIGPAHAAKARLVDGQLLGWYGSRVIEGLRYLEELAAAEGP